MTQLGGALLPPCAVRTVDDPLELGLQRDQASEAALKRSVDLHAVRRSARPHAL